MSPENTTWLKSVFLKSWRPYAWIAVLGFLLYLKTLFFDFTYLDDNVLILDNINFLKDFANIGLIFKQEVFHILHSSATYYRPILTLSFMLDAHLGGDKASIYHLTNIILHLVASSLVFTTLLKLKYKRSLSFLAAVLFTLHPILSQAVAWIPGRNDSLLAIFALASFIFFINVNEGGSVIARSEATKQSDRSPRFARDDIEDAGGQSRDNLNCNIINSVLCALFFALAIFTKETALILPLVFLLYYFLIAESRAKAKEFSLLAITSGIAFALWYWGRSIALSGASGGLGFLATIKFFYLNSYAILLYIGKIFYPFNLSVLPILEDSNKLFGIAGIITLILLIIFTKKRRWKWIVFGAIWFLIFLIPTFIRPNTSVAPDFIEHRAYLPLLGFMIVLLETDLFKKLNLKTLWQLYTTLAVILIFAGVNFIHLDNFKDRLSFWLNAATNSPHSPLAHRNLGVMYYFSGYFDQAEIEYYKSLELNPYETMAHNNLGVLYGEEGRAEEAIEQYEAELKFNPDYDNALFNLGVLKYRAGEKAEAEKLWLKTINSNPDYAAAYQNLSVYHYESGSSEQANYFQNKFLELSGMK
ncbi:hypothetical protein A2215_00190 [Candidatus Berkelbacteria bacterium RIFOXYA2_FULL_43_10]|uniref:Uncharacterized protein n=1 Tax=Candidatus Berkelbacteria bacterium RIFOXYA2_FULL_43_10 TaxID=1797472 RepID=A0A1F5E9J3_9BACT|nr:MAG: hypothetical protein A2215_00190 [Candidatus Berkelbacteria bacterium RIFOXYA2_FULL_43_10]